jgi:hypothetical protein
MVPRGFEFFVNHENKPPIEEWISSPYLAREAQGMLL